jgi:hypothetical protein
MYLHIEEKSKLRINSDSYPIDDYGTEQIQMIQESQAFKRSCIVLSERREYPEGVLESQFIDESYKIFCIISSKNDYYTCSFENTRESWSEYMKLLDSIRQNKQ